MLAASAIVTATLLAGPSYEGRPITAVHHGGAGTRVLVVGSIHGNETAGHAVVRALRRTAPNGFDLWTVTSANPDGARRRSRQNARGVDLNRNFPRRWRGGGRAFGTYYPGRSAASEPETRAVERLVERIRPDVTIWYHQRLALTNLSTGADPAVVRAYARRSGLPARRLPPYRGTATSWQNHSRPGSSAFVVELPSGALSAAAVARHVAAVRDAAFAGVPTATSPPR